MSAGEIAGLIAAGAFLMLVIVLAVPILKLGRTVDAATRAITDLTDRTDPLLRNANEAVENMNTTLGQAQICLDGVNMQLAKVDTITEHAIWLGAHVAVAVGDEAVAKRALTSTALPKRQPAATSPTKR